MSQLASPLPSVPLPSDPLPSNPVPSDPLPSIPGPSVLPSQEPSVTQQTQTLKTDPSVSPSAVSRTQIESPRAPTNSFRSTMTASAGGNNTSPTSQQSGSSIGPGATAAIVVAVVAVVVAAVGIYIFRKMGLSPSGKFKQRIKKEDTTLDFAEALKPEHSQSKRTIAVVSGDSLINSASKNNSFVAYNTSPISPQNYVSYTVNDKYDDNAMRSNSNSKRMDPNTSHDVGYSNLNASSGERSNYLRNF